jgi:hypothetical protein
MCIDNNAIINNYYGMLQDLILLLKIPTNTRKKITRNLQNIWARALKKIRQLWAIETAKR